MFSFSLSIENPKKPPSASTAKKELTHVLLKELCGLTLLNNRQLARLIEWIDENIPNQLDIPKKQRTLEDEAQRQSALDTWINEKLEKISPTSERREWRQAVIFNKESTEIGHVSMRSYRIKFHSSHMNNGDFHNKLLIVTFDLQDQWIGWYLLPYPRKFITPPIAATDAYHELIQEEEWSKLAAWLEQYVTQRELHIHLPTGSALYKHLEQQGLTVHMDMPGVNPALPDLEMCSKKKSLKNFIDIAFELNDLLKKHSC